MKDRPKPACGHARSYDCNAITSNPQAALPGLGGPIISADPYEQGLEDWLDDPDEYEYLSRLQNLTIAIKEHLDKAAEQIQANAGIASVRYGIETILDRLEELDKELQPAHEVLAQQVKELAQERDRLEQLVIEAYLGVQGDVDTMRSALLDGLDACVDQRALKNLIERESSGQVTRLTGMEHIVFLDILKSYQVSAINLSPEGWAKDFFHAKNL